MKKAIALILLMLVVSCSTETAQWGNTGEPKELQQFGVECFDDEGFYTVYYLAPEPATYEDEIHMCEFPGLHGKFEE